MCGLKMDIAISGTVDIEKQMWAFGKAGEISGVEDGREWKMIVYGIGGRTKMGAEEFIIYEDSELLVLRKPAGLAVQSASSRQRDLESIVKTWLYEKYGKANPYLGLIHRLDQPVQGLVVFALTPQAAASLSAQVQDGRMKKQYQAVVQGCPPQPEGTLTHFLKKNGRNNCSETVNPDTPGAKKAVLQYRILGSISLRGDDMSMEERLQEDHPQQTELCVKSNGYSWHRAKNCMEIRSLLQVTLLTGRHHQIRVQLAAEGMPICGDQKYNSLAQKGEQIALCATHLEFFHPGTGEKVHFDCKAEGGAFSYFLLRSIQPSMDS